MWRCECNRRCKFPIRFTMVCVWQSTDIWSRICKLEPLHDTPCHRHITMWKLGSDKLMIWMGKSTARWIILLLRAKVFRTKVQIDGLVQERRSTSVIAMELRLCSIKPLKCYSHVSCNVQLGITTCKVWGCRSEILDTDNTIIGFIMFLMTASENSDWISAGHIYD